MRNACAAFTSTTTKKEVAMSYIRGKKMPVLFKIETGDIDRGCTLSWVSQYPLEDEILIPAMSHLEITGKPSVEETPKGSGFLVTVYPARINCITKNQVSHLSPLHALWRTEIACSLTGCVWEGADDRGDRDEKEAGHFVHDLLHRPGVAPRFDCRSPGAAEAFGKADGNLGQDTQEGFGRIRQSEEGMTSARRQGL